MHHSAEKGDGRTMNEEHRIPTGLQRVSLKGHTFRNDAYASCSYDKMATEVVSAPITKRHLTTNTFAKFSPCLFAS